MMVRLSIVTEHTDVQLLINYAYPCLSSALKRGLLPPENSHNGIKNGQGGEGLFLAHWLSYEKLNTLYALWYCRMAGSATKYVVLIGERFH